jgi:hypothetical protein
MNHVKTDISVLEKSHTEWLSNLCAYEEELKHIDAITRQLQTSVNDLHYQQHLRELRNEILLQRGLVTAISDEVIEWRKMFSEREDKKMISLAELIQNNRLRDKVRKTEQSVFMLKYQVNKLLSKAS